MGILPAHYYYCVQKSSCGTSRAPAPPWQEVFENSLCAFIRRHGQNPLRSGTSAPELSSTHAGVGRRKLTLYLLASSLFRISRVLRRKECKVFVTACCSINGDSGIFSWRETRKEYGRNVYPCDVVCQIQYMPFFTNFSVSGHYEPLPRPRDDDLRSIPYTILLAQCHAYWLRPKAGIQPSQRHQ